MSQSKFLISNFFFLITTKKPKIEIDEFHQLFAISGKSTENLKKKMTTISSNLIQQNILEYIIRIENQRQKMYTKRKVLIRTGTGKKSNGRVKQAGSSTSTPFISPKYII